MRFAWTLALRFLMEGRVQSLLILSGVTLGVAVIIFLSALISGLQSSIIEKTLGTQPHITIRPPDQVVLPVFPEGDGIILRRIQKRAQAPRSINNWQIILRDLEAMPDITATAPIITGAAFALRGDAERSIVLMGVTPDTYQNIVPVNEKILSGRFRLGGGECVIGDRIADDLGLDRGDKLRISTSDGRNDVCTITGIFSFGVKDIDRRWVFVPVRTAQSLLDLAGGMTAIELRVDNFFAADSISGRIQRQHDVIAESWMQNNADLLTALRSQSISSNVIMFFVLVSVAFGIASVLAVSIVQRSRQIGILRAMGTTSADILLVFLIQGAMVGLAGSVLGAMAGSLLISVFTAMVTTPQGLPLFPVSVTPLLISQAILLAVVTGLLAAALPARRAASLDPVQAIRHE